MIYLEYLPHYKKHCALSLVTDPLVQKFLYSEVSEALSCIWSSKDCDRGKWRLKQRVLWVRKQLHRRYFKGFLLSPSYNFRDKLLSQRPLQTACHYYKPVIFSLTSMYRGWSLNLITFVAFGEWLPLIHCNPSAGLLIAMKPWIFSCMRAPVEGFVPGHLLRQSELHLFCRALLLIFNTSCSCISVLQYCSIAVLQPCCMSWWAEA